MKVLMCLVVLVGCGGGRAPQLKQPGPDASLQSDVDAAGQGDGAVEMQSDAAALEQDATEPDARPDASPPPPCGDLFQLCCAGDTCNAGFACLQNGGIGNACFHCGGANEPCCAGDVCQAGRTCEHHYNNPTPLKQCTECSVVGDACCSDNGLYCYNGLHCTGAGMTCAP